MPNSVAASGRVTLKSLADSGALYSAPVLEDDLPGILYQLGERRLPEGTGWALLNESVLMCYDRQPREGVPSTQTGMFFVRKEGGKWHLT
jgi:hypothetical protein